MARADGGNLGRGVILDLLIEITRINQKTAFGQRIAEEEMPAGADTDFQATCVCALDCRSDFGSSSWADDLGGIYVRDTSIEELAAELLVICRPLGQAVWQGSSHDDVYKGTSE